jgi:tetratricopeptide (TPR) repeat protein
VIDYSRTSTVVLAHGWCYWDWIFPAGVATFLIVGRRSRPALLVAAIIFIVGILPVLGFVPSMFAFFSITADHYLYFSLLGLAIAVAWTLSRWPKRILQWFTIVVLIGLTALSIHQGGYWYDDATLFGHDTQTNPNSYIGFLNLAAMYARQHDSSSAIAAYQRAIPLNPRDPGSWGRLSSELYAVGNDDAAIDAAQKAVDLQIQHPTLRPHWGGDNALLGHLLIAKGHYLQALPYLETAAKEAPDEPRIKSDLESARAHAATQPVQ